MRLFFWLKIMAFVADVLAVILFCSDERNPDHYPDQMAFSQIADKKKDLVFKLSP